MEDKVEKKLPEVWILGDLVLYAAYMNSVEMKG